MEGNFIAYYRVSTDQQGRSGLGLEGQREAVLDYLNGGGWSLVAEFTEVESGKNGDRPTLAEALAAAKKAKATLIIAKLDRLSRSVSFIANLMDSGVDFRAADMPNADRFMLHVYAAMAEEERRRISERTKVALAAAKARGVRLGCPVPSRGAQAAAIVHRDKAERFAANVLPVIKEVQAAGVTSLRGVAKALNARGVQTARGGAWGPQSVANVLERAQGAC